MQYAILSGATVLVIASKAITYAEKTLDLEGHGIDIKRAIKRTTRTRKKQVRLSRFCFIIS